MFSFRPEDAARIETLIKKDGKFLETQGLLDYSLFVVIERVEQKSESELLLAQEVAKSSPNAFLSIDGRELYHIGIIDYL